MARWLNFFSATARHHVRSMSPIRASASMASVVSATTNPVLPSSINSGIAPRRHPTTGVPTARLSITTEPNGSSHAERHEQACGIGRPSAMSRRTRRPRNDWCVEVGGRRPRNTAGDEAHGPDEVSGIPALAATSIARWGCLLRSHPADEYQTLVGLPTRG